MILYLLAETRLGGYEAGFFRPVLKILYRATGRRDVGIPPYNLWNASHRNSEIAQ